MRQFTIQSIKHKLFAAMFLAPFIPVALALGTGGYLFFQYAHANMLERLSIQSKHYTSVVDTYIDERIKDLADLDAAFSTAQLDSALLEQALRQLSATHTEFLDLAIIDQNGRVHFYAGPSVFKGTHIESGQWHEDALRRGVSVSGVIAGQMGIPHWVVAKRMVGHAGSYVLRIALDAGIFTRLIMDMRDDGVEVFLLNSTGEIIAGSGGQIMTRSQEFPSATVHEYLGSSFWDDRTQTAYSSRALQHGGWFMVARKPASSMLRSTDSTVLFLPSPSFAEASSSF